MGGNIKIFIRLMLFNFIIASSLFVAAGTVYWWNAWILVLIYFVLSLLLSGVLFKKSPDLMRERMAARKKAEKWDQIIVPFLAIILPMLSIIFAGIDKRFGWTSTFPLYVSCIAIVILLLSLLFTFWAMMVNKYFSSHVRIQKDRGQVVISNGPYRFLRHPGYTGVALFNIAVPFLLNSYVSLIISVLTIALLVLRTYLEDKTLMNQLDGYIEYAGKVKYRLVPLLW